MVHDHNVNAIHYSDRARIEFASWEGQREGGKWSC